jgi:hypothetical protein
MWTSPPVDALSWLDQSICEAQESLAHLSDAFAYVQNCALPDALPDGRLPPETERVLLAEQRRGLLAAALLRRLERRVQAQIARVGEPHVIAAPVEGVQV